MPERAVRVAVPAKIAFDIGSMQKVTAGILGKLGCPGCHSGWDIRFMLERSFVVDEQLNIRGGLEGVVITDG
jgi:hypothetical protein